MMGLIELIRAKAFLDAKNNSPPLLVVRSDVAMQYRSINYFNAYLKNKLTKAVSTNKTARTIVIMNRIRSAPRRVV